MELSGKTLVHLCAADEELDVVCGVTFLDSNL